MDSEKMDLQLMAGQRLMLGFDGHQFTPLLETYITRYKIGGLILFKTNIQSLEQVTELIQTCRQTAASAGLPPLFIATDQEGGVVARFRQGFTPFKGNPHIHTRKDAEHFAATTASELGALGINMNFAPVVDVAYNTPDSIMSDRSFPGDADRVAVLGKRVIQTLQESGMMAVAKHFPGIGRTVKDSHFFLPELSVDLQTLQENDLIPFKVAIRSNVSAIMLSHIFYPQLDPDRQASLSRKIAWDLLRKQLGYNGLVLTDDLDMKAISMDMRTCLDYILGAGIDIALICHSGPNIQIALDHVFSCLENDEKLYQDGITSLERILAAKEKFLAS